jgi:predicted PurR-regulated permease PerM
VSRDRLGQRQNALLILTATVVGAIALACLYWAQVILVPLALAIFICFLLTPLVTALQRRRVPKLLAVVAAVLLATFLMGGIGWIVVAEAKAVIVDLPQYTDNIKDKLKSLQEAGQGRVITSVRRLIDEITGSRNTRQKSEGTVNAPAISGKGTPIVVQPPSVVVEPEVPTWVTRLLGFVSPVLESLAEAALTLVLVIFMLLNREDLRNRLIRLVGHGRITLTTKALDDAGQRISRYLLVQLLINSAYGLAFGLGLFALGFKHALLWGFIVGALRYVPYLGTTISSVLLITLSLAMFPGWTHAVLVLCLIASLEVITYNFVEPRLFSQSIGVSEVALLLAAAFWAFLWGPIGLILSGPLTVCLVVLGEYVPQLEFLAVLLGDEQALNPDVSLYQRLFARDQDEASQIVLAHAKVAPPERVFDDLLVPALTYAKRDHNRDVLDEEDLHAIVKAAREIVEDFGGDSAESDLTAPGGAPANGRAASRVLLLGCPARDEADQLALEMLARLLDPAKWELELPTPAALAAEVLALVAKTKPGIVCIGSLPPRGLAQARYLCKRLRAQFPELKILVGRWGLKTHLQENREHLLAAGADHVATTLLETRDHLKTWLPVLRDEQTPVAALADRK